MYFKISNLAIKIQRDCHEKLLHNAANIFFKYFREYNDLKV